MIKLANILDEVKIEKPIDNIITLNALLNVDKDSEYSLIDRLATYNSFDQWYNDEVDEDDEDNEYTKSIELAKIYFKWLKNGNIFVKEVEDTDGDNELVFPKPFKRMITYGKGYNNVMIILTTF